MDKFNPDIVTLPRCPKCGERALIYTEKRKGQDACLRCDYEHPGLKTIIAGSREIVDYEIVKEAILKSFIHISEVVSGTAAGVDRLGERYSREHKIPIKRFPPDWVRFGKSAGYLRNQEMADYVGRDGALVAVWNGSKGTAHMIEIANRKGMTVFVYEV